MGRLYLTPNPLALIVEALAIEDSVQTQRLTRVLEGTNETDPIFRIVQQECPVYTVLNAEKVIAAFGVFAKAVQENDKLAAHLRERKNLIAPVQVLVTEYIQVKYLPRCSPLNLLGMCIVRLGVPNAFCFKKF